MCEICNHTPCLIGCPNYEPPKPHYYCSICGEGIINGEEYIKNTAGQYAHYDCVNTVRDVLDWLGYKVEVMNEDTQL